MKNIKSPHFHPSLINQYRNRERLTLLIDFWKCPVRLFNHGIILLVKQPSCREVCGLGLICSEISWLTVASYLRTLHCVLFEDPRVGQIIINPLSRITLSSKIQS